MYSTDCVINSLKEADKSTVVEIIVWYYADFKHDKNDNNINQVTAGMMAA